MSGDDMKEWNSDLVTALVAAQKHFGGEVSLKRDTHRWCWVGKDGLAIGAVNKITARVVKYAQPVAVLPSGGWIPADEIV